MEFKLHQNKWQSRWIADIPLEVGRRDVLSEAIKVKVAEMDGDAFYTEGNTVFGRKDFDDFPTKKQLMEAKEELQAELIRRVTEILKLRDYLKILKEVE